MTEIKTEFKNKYLEEIREGNEYLKDSFSFTIKNSFMQLSSAVTSFSKEMQLIPYIKSRPGLAGEEVSNWCFGEFEDWVISKLLSQATGITSNFNLNLYSEKSSVSLIVSTKKTKRIVDKFVIKLNTEGNPLTFH